MKNKEGVGFSKLAKKTFAVITTSLSTLMIDQSSASAITSKIDEVPNKVNYENFQNNIIKPPFVLKLNQTSALATNSSHGSHSSHSSHTSHYSSSSDAPSQTIDSTTQSTYKPQVSSNTNSVKTDTTTINGKLTYHMLGSRNLRQGDEGTDIQELQLGLIKLGYKTVSAGSFEVTTELAVMKFQVANSLHPDGAVDSLTLRRIQSQLK